MEVQTSYGICKNVDLDHLQPYLGGIGAETSCFMFTDYIVGDDSGSYLLFGFEVWHDKDDEFHFFVEEGFEDGSSDTYNTDLSPYNKEQIKKLYKEYIKNLK